MGGKQNRKRTINSGVSLCIGTHIADTKSQLINQYHLIRIADYTIPSKRSNSPFFSRYDCNRFNHCKKNIFELFSEKKLHNTLGFWKWNDEKILPAKYNFFELIFIKDFKAQDMTNNKFIFSQEIRDKLLKEFFYIPDNLNKNSNPLLIIGETESSYICIDISFEISKNKHSMKLSDKIYNIYQISKYSCINSDEYIPKEQRNQIQTRIIYQKSSLPKKIGFINPYQNEASFESERWSIIISDKLDGFEDNLSITNINLNSNLINDDNLDNDNLSYPKNSILDPNINIPPEQKERPNSPINNFIDFLSANLKKIGVANHYVPLLSGYIAGAYCTNLPLILLGNTNELFAKVISITLSGKDCSKLFIKTGYNNYGELINLIKKQESKVVILYNFVGYNDEVLFTRISKDIPEKYILFSVSIKEIINKLPPGLFGYLGIIDCESCIKYPNNFEFIDELDIDKFPEFHYDLDYSNIYIHQLRMLTEAMSLTQGYRLSRLQLLLTMKPFIENQNDLGILLIPELLTISKLYNNTDSFLKSINLFSEKYYYTQANLLIKGEDLS